MTKYGRPALVVPASSTRAMFGWSMRARAWRSASKRAMTCFESMPALMSLSATTRLTGAVCWAIQTVPMPPSPICSSSLYGPMRPPGTSGDDACSAAPEIAPVAGDSAAGFSRKLPAPSWSRSKCSTCRRNSGCPAQPRDVAELDQFGRLGVGAGQPREGGVDVQHVVEAFGRGGGELVEVQASATAAPLLALLAAGVIDEDAAHRLRRGGEEVPATV